MAKTKKGHKKGATKQNKGKQHNQASDAQKENSDGEKQRKMAKKTSQGFGTYIKKVLVKVENGMMISGNAKQQVDGLLRSVAENISLQALRLVGPKVKNQSTVTFREIETAMEILFAGNLAKGCKKRATKAVKKYKVSKKKKETSKNDKPVRREQRAGLLFSIALCEKFIRRFGEVKKKIGSSAPVYLAAVLQNLCAEIIVHASALAKDKKKSTITVRHIFTALSTTEELNLLMERFNIQLLGCGVLPYIHPELYPKKEDKKKAAARRRKKRENEEGGNADKKKKYLPGTVALREIRNAQKISNNLLFAKLPFQNLARKVLLNNSKGTKIHFAKDARCILQHYVEQKVEKVLEKANKVSIHAQRQTVYPVDITLALELDGEKDMLDIDISKLPPLIKSKRKKKNEAAVEAKEEEETSTPTQKRNNLAQGSIKTMARRAGIKRISQDCPELIRKVIVGYMDKVLNNAYKIMLHRKAKTLVAKDLSASFDSYNEHVTLSTKLGTKHFSLH